MAGIYSHIRVYLLVAGLFLIFQDGSGKAHPNFGIIGGKKINITEAPFFANFQLKHNIIYIWCGAAIVSERFLVTSGNCATMIGSKKSIVTTGDDIFDSKLSKKYDVDKVFIHPSFNLSTLTHDIAVIKLKEKMMFSDTAKPIKMADKDFVINDGDMARVLGRETDPSSKDLYEVDVPIFPQEKCKETLMPINDVDDSMICAGGEKNKGITITDFGGPLVYKDLLVGLISWGRVRYNLDDIPQVYARVSYMRDFVEKIIKENE